ncbi:sensor histidine kinase [Parasporobacterium paucivorans]|uniref:histidine kinase n=1 Tax=Parasporobacterium paucivorans DSM 15970 TaxID=1122934 RepID=A0A1M6G4Z5_9FIRM|nr:HAMP domain-containing sensor histidine kinase [Parasporobacterium paucivorans]SHJ04857.1 Signal transduction histidine kinase [Parasporobacterium paucivorans DSM 15970]
MKHRKISIKWKIFAYLLSFTTLLLVLLWLFQTVYLDVFYRTIKTRELNSAMDNVVSVIDEDDLGGAVQTISRTYDMCILVADSLGYMQYSNEATFDCVIHKLTPQQIRVLILDAAGHDGTMTVNVSDTSKLISNRVGDRFEGIANMPEKTEADSVILVKNVIAKDGTAYTILVNAVITPVGATTHTLRIQLIYISVILVLLSLVIALLISRRVSKSIIKVNSSAKELGAGNFDVKFNANDYKEIAELSETLNKTAQELSKTEALQRELIANVSHDLRTPLTMITAYSEMMKDLPGENNPENLQVVIDEAKRLGGLVNDLLDLSKIQAGVSRPYMTRFDLTESIKSVIERYARLIQQDGYKIEFQYEDNVSVEADEQKLYQVIYNLINNAINYTGDDKKVLVRQVVRDGRVRIEVSDTGIGIPEEELDNVWERYYKIDKSHKRSVMGTGLGLSIVKNILQMHKAGYGVDSVINEGSTFWFELEIISDKN